MTIWRVLFLAEQYGRFTLTLDEVAYHGDSHTGVATRRPANPLRRHED